MSEMKPPLFEIFIFICTVLTCALTLTREQGNASSALVTSFSFQ
jgi:hypothetical protein